MWNFNDLASADTLNRVIAAGVASGAAYTQVQHFFTALDIKPPSNRKFIDQERDIIFMTHNQMEASVEAVRKEMREKFPGGQIDLIMFDERWSSRGYIAEEATSTAVWNGKICAYRHVMRRTHSNHRKEVSERNYDGPSKGMDG